MCSSWISNPSFSNSVSFTASKFASEPTIVAFCAREDTGAANRHAPIAQAITAIRRPKDMEKRLAHIVLNL